MGCRQGGSFVCLGLLKLMILGFGCFGSVGWLLGLEFGAIEIDPKYFCFGNFPCLDSSTTQGEWEVPKLQRPTKQKPPRKRRKPEATDR